MTRQSDVLLSQMELLETITLAVFAGYSIHCITNLLGKTIDSSHGRKSLTESVDDHDRSQLAGELLEAYDDVEEDLSNRR